MIKRRVPVTHYVELEERVQWDIFRELLEELTTGLFWENGRLVFEQDHPGSSYTRPAGEAYQDLPEEDKRIIIAAIELQRAINLYKGSRIRVKN